jgi:hypothetical protein
VKIVRKKKLFCYDECGGKERRVDGGRLKPTYISHLQRLSHPRVTPDNEETSVRYKDQGIRFHLMPCPVIRLMIRSTRIYCSWTRDLRGDTSGGDRVMSVSPLNSIVMQILIDGKIEIQFQRFPGRLHCSPGLSKGHVPLGLRLMSSLS